jgi:very-short-patch-repair endonuclease
MRNKIEVLCKSCNEIVETYPRDLINGRYGCPNCSKRSRKSNDKFLDEVKKMYKNEYIFDEVYINNKTPIRCRHSICGNSFRVSPGNFLHSKTQCPYCRVISKGENRVRKVLRKLDLEFVEQYKHDKCHDKRKLPFDFYVIEEDTLIEFDGKQHFQKSFNESDLDFNLRKYHDKLKDEFARDYNYRLLRISYKDINKIEDIIINFFK